MDLLVELQRLINFSPVLSEEERAFWSAKILDLSPEQVSELFIIFQAEEERIQKITTEYEGRIKKASLRYSKFLQHVQHEVLPKIRKGIEKKSRGEDDERAEQLLKEI